MPSDAPEVVDGELVPYDPQPPITLFGTTDPRIALERMADVATALVDVIENKHLYATINGRRHITVDARASNFDVGLDLRLGARRPHRDPHLSIGVSAGEDHRVGSALVGLRRSQIRHRHIESAQFRRRLGAQPGHHRRRVVGIAHRPRYRCRGVHAVASGKVVECVEHCASLLAQRYDQVAEQHRGADAVLIADR